MFTCSESLDLCVGELHCIGKSVKTGGRTDGLAGGLRTNARTDRKQTYGRTLTDRRISMDRQTDTDLWTDRHRPTDRQTDTDI